MSHDLTVPTEFVDISAMAQGLRGRFFEDELILYGAEAFDEGSKLSFCLLLEDDTVALEGSGFVTAIYDNEGEREESVGFDVVLRGLQLDGAAGVIYEQLVLMSGDDEAEEAVQEATTSVDAQDILADGIRAVVNLLRPDDECIDSERLEVAP